MGCERAKAAGYHPDTYRALVRSLCGNDPAKLSETITRKIHENAPLKEKLLLKAHIDSKIFYNK